MANFPFISVGTVIAIFVEGVLIIIGQERIAFGLVFGWLGAMVTCGIKFKMTGGL